MALVDLLSTGVAFSSAIPSQGNFDEEIGRWTVDTVNAGQALTLVLNVVVSDPEAIVNRVQVQDVD